MNEFIIKDRFPLDTVSLIKDILRENGIMTTEKWYNEDTLFPSLRVVIENTNLGSNGKGINKEYARASAYAELLERLFNNGYFLQDNNDEILSFSDSIKFLNRYKNSNLDFSILKEVNYCNKRFKSITTGEFYNLSLNLVSFLYGTNGMFYGNTFEEGANEAIFEIFERTVLKMVQKNKICGRFVDSKLLNSYNQNCIIEIEKMTHSHIKIIDYSFESRFPVCAIILINENGYYIKFGSHIFLNIAVSRCLTELMQGRNINLVGLQNELELNYEFDELNFLRIVENGKGVYPISILYKNDCLQSAFLDEDSFTSNKEIFGYLCGFLKNKKLDILCFENTTEFFSVGQIIIPTLSEIFVNNKSEVEHYFYKLLIARSYMNNDYEKFLKYTYEDIKIFEWENMNGEIGHFYGNEIYLSNIGKLNINLFFAAICLEHVDFVLAFKYLKKYKEQQNRKNETVPLYYLCLMSICYFKEINEINYKKLTNYFPEELVNEVLDDIENKSHLEKMFFNGNKKQIEKIYGLWLKYGLNKN